MDSMRNRERILEAIDQLRRRKARPDIQRICNYLFRRFSINSIEAKSDLQWCVENDIVLKVEYKGSISYRNAAKKYSHLKRYDSMGELVDNKANRKFAQLLTSAFGELFVNEPDYLHFGVPAEELVTNILCKDSVRYTKKYISILIDKEVENGGLIKMENERYLMGPQKEGVGILKRKGFDFEKGAFQNLPIYPPTARKKSQDHFKPHIKVEDNMETPIDIKLENGINGSLRVGGRRKRAKKVFDPSDTHTPKKRGRPAGSLNRTTIEKHVLKTEDDPRSRTPSVGREQGGVCSVCHNQIKRGQSDRVVSCRECSSKAHFNCLNGDDMLLRMHLDNTWQCPPCKTCVVCYETSNAGYLIVCDLCGDSYHAGCHQPQINEKLLQSNKWTCMNCQTPVELKINQINDFKFSDKISAASDDGRYQDDDDSSSQFLSGNSTPIYHSLSTSPIPPQLSLQNDIIQHSRDGTASDSQSNKDSDEDINIDPTIPDASNWSCKEVYEYFLQYFPKEAKIFREQDIDGRSLLLLRRIDVLTNLKLKLGPALKIYKHVVKLQVRRDDSTLYWL